MPSPISDCRLLLSHSNVVPRPTPTFDVSFWVRSHEHFTPNGGYILRSSVQSESSPLFSSLCLSASVAPLLPLTQLGMRVALPFLLDRTKGCKAAVLVENLNVLKSNFSQQVQLKQQGPRQILLLDISEHLSAVVFTFKLHQVLPISLPHHGLHGRIGMVD